VHKWPAPVSPPRSALDIFDKIFRFLQADSCRGAVEFNGLSLFASAEGISNSGGEILVWVKFDAEIFLTTTKVQGDKDAPLFDLSTLNESELVFLRRIVLKARQVDEGE
jgi:hypothetical protein